MPARIPIWSVIFVLLVSLAVPARAAGDAAARIAAAKARDVDGYAPLLARGDAVAESEPNDTPATANGITVGTVLDAAVAGTLDEDWFLLGATPGAHLTLSTSTIIAEVTDTVLEVYASDGVSRIAMDDDSGMGLFSALQSVEVPADGQLLLRVTRYSALGDDAYRLLVETGTPPPPAPANDTVATAEQFGSCNTAITGSTQGATNQVAELSCLGIDPLGGEVFYRLSVPFSFQLNILVEPTGPWDLSVYLFTNPADPAGSCVDAADIAYAGEGETVRFVSEALDQQPVELYVAVDSWAGAAAGSFILSTRCDFVVPNEQASFGTLKARFQAN